MQSDSADLRVSRPADDERAPLGVEEVKDRAALAPLAAEWDDLSDRGQDGSLFSSCDWMSSWLESFQGERPLCLLFARRGTRLVGVFPLVGGIRGWLYGGAGLETPLNEQSPCGGLLCEGDPTPVVAAFLDHIRSTRGRLPVRLPLLPAASGAAGALRSIAAAGRYRVYEKPSRSSTRILVQGSWADYLATRSKHSQREWRRKRKRLDEAGRVETRTVRTAADLPGALQEVLEVESRSWKHDNGTSFQREAGVADFYRRLAERCAERGRLRLSLLYLNGRPAAHCFAVVYGNELLALKTSFDAELASLSPGLVLMLAVSEQAFAEGLAAIDLLGHPDRWKMEMASEQRPHVDMCIFPRGLIRCETCAFLEGHVEPLLRGKLPPRVTKVGRQMLDRMRRAR